MLSRAIFLSLLLPVVASAQGPSYTTQIQPILHRSCNGCHTGWVAKGGLHTQSVGTLKSGGKSGPAIVPGDLEKSVLMQRIAPGKGVEPMPPKDARQLLPEEIELLRAWVVAGAKDDSTAARVQVPAVAPVTTPKPSVRALAYDPQGRYLVAGSGASVVILDPADGKIVGRLEGVEGSITGLAIRPDGKFLVVASGQAGALGELTFFTMGPDSRPAGKVVRKVTAHLDLIHEIAFSPDGKLLATCSYDRLVRLFDGETGARRSDLRDHSDSVYGLGFSHDGKYLASAGADRAIKIWDVASGKRLFTLSEATDWIYALAWHPTKSILAAGGVDRNLRVYDITPTEGKLLGAAFAHEGGVLRLRWGPQGQTIYSLGEDRVAKAWDGATVSEKRVYPKQNEAVHALATLGAGKPVALGRHDGLIVLLEEATGKPQGSTATGAITPEENAGGSPRQGQAIQLTATIEGKIFPAGDVDFYRFDAKPGQEVGVQVVLPMGSKLESVLELIDPRGDVVASSTSGLLAYVCSQAGAYSLGIRDREFRGDAAYTYTLKVGAIPVVTSVFPMGLPRGTEGEVTLTGANLGDARTTKIKIPADAMPGSKIPVPVTTPLGAAPGAPQIVVGEFPEATKAGATLAVPGTGNGRIEKPLQVDTWKFTAKKGQRLIIETFARRGGSPLDSMVEVCDAQGRPLSIATLRGVAKVFTTFRDNDSVTSGMRLESWNELSVNDYVLVGTELARIQVLPRNPDDDCRFFSEAGQRLGFLGTTPTHHPLGEALYKVSLHPPGATFPPNGLPVVTLQARNDDGGPGYGKDSCFHFDPPADGEYQVRVSDSRDMAGVDFNYRVTVRPPRPDFSLRVAPMTPSVSKGGALPLDVTVERKDDFQGPIDIEVKGLPAGLTAPRTTVLAGENSTSLALLAGPEAKDVPAFQVVGKATIDGKIIERSIAGGKISVIDAGEIVTTTEQSEIVIQPGGTTRITVIIERRQGFAARIPIEVKGLPHGVRVLDVGLNGIMINPKETRRTFVLYAEPFVPALEHPIVVFAKREGKNTEHAAPSVLLRVEGKPQ